MLEQLLTEQKNPASAAIDQMSTEAMLRVINDEDKKVAEAVERAIPRIAEAEEGLPAALLRGGCRFYYGAGAHGAVGGLGTPQRPPPSHRSHEMVPRASEEGYARP